MTATNAPSSDLISLGSGEILFARFDTSGNRSTYAHLGNCSKIAISLVDDVITMRTSMDASRGIYKRVTRGRDVNVAITAHENSAANMALALMGDTSTFTQTTGTVTETLAATQVAAGAFVKLANRNVTITSIIQGTATWASTTATTSDYVVWDSASGMLQIGTAGTNVTTAATAVAIYTKASLSLPTVLGATKTKIEGSLFFIADPTTGPQDDLEVFRASLTPGGEKSLIGDNFDEYVLNMAALDDSVGSYGGSSTYPYFRTIRRGYA